MFVEQPKPHQIWLMLMKYKPTNKFYTSFILAIQIPLKKNMFFCLHIVQFSNLTLTKLQSWGSAI